MIAQMATVLMKAKEAIATAKNSKLIKLQIFNGVSSLKLLQSEEQKVKHYQHNDSVNDMYSVMAQIVRDNLLHEIETSPCPFYGIEIDEATDTADKSILVAFIRFINSEGELKTSFLGVKELVRTDADCVFDAALSILQENSLPIDHMVGLATDGASVMTGVHKGVATKFKRIIPHLVTVHCMAHRLQLVSEKAANCVPIITKYIAVLNQFAKSLKFSTKFQRILAECKQVSDVKARKIKQIFFTRWLSFVDSVQALAGCLSPVISALQVTAMERGLEGRAVLHGVAKQMGTVKFVVLTHFLADVVGVLGLLSLTLQKEDVTYAHAKSGIDAAMVSIQSMLTHPGPYMKEVMDIIPEDVDSSGCVMYKDQELKDSEKDRQKLKEATIAFVEQIVDRLGAAFPDRDALGDFQALSPKECNLLPPTDATEKIERLCKLYSPTFVDREAAMGEWLLLQNVQKQPLYCTLDLKGFLQKVINPQRETYQQLVVLASIGVALPVTSVNCERGISGYNALKTDCRNALGVNIMDSLMMLYLESPDLEDFNFHRAFDLWVKRKERKGLVAMTKC